MTKKLYLRLNQSAQRSHPTGFPLVSHMCSYNTLTVTRK